MAISAVAKWPSWSSSVLIVRSVKGRVFTLLRHNNTRTIIIVHGHLRRGQVAVLVLVCPHSEVSQRPSLPGCRRHNNSLTIQYMAILSCDGQVAVLVNNTRMGVAGWLSGYSVGLEI